MTCIDNLSDTRIVHLALVDVNHEQNRRHVSNPLDHVLKAKIIRSSTDQLNYLKMPGQASNECTTLRLERLRLGRYRLAHLRLLQSRLGRLRLN